MAELVWAIVLKLYDFSDYKSSSEGDSAPRDISVMSAAPEALAAASAPFAALAEGVFFTRDLVNEPANTLTTDEFAARLVAMSELGLEVEILGEPELLEMGARALLAVGQGSDCESKLVVMKWMGGGDEPPLALVGKGVVFDTGGISLKPAGGMEDMTMDMGGRRRRLRRDAHAGAAQGQDKRCGRGRTCREHAGCARANVPATSCAR